MIFNKRTNKIEKLLKGDRYVPGKFIDSYGNIFVYPDQQSFAWTYKELFEKQVYFFKTKKKDPYIIDCGANIGVSIIYFKHLFPNSKILAFEPDPFLFDYLEKNIKMNNLKSVDLIKKAVWNQESIIEFFQEKSDSGRIDLNNSFDIINSNKIKVESTLLSQYIQERVDFLKIDIEGAEYPVLLEIKNKLSLIDRLFIESHSFKGDKQDLHKILKLLYNKNFRYYLTEGAVTTDNPFLKVKSYLNMDMQTNIHAINNN